MTGNNTSKLTSASAVTAYVSVAIFATMIAIMAFLLLRQDVAYIHIVAAGFVSVVLFILVGVLQFRRPYSLSTLIGSAIALLVMATHVSFSYTVSSILAPANLGLNVLVALIPAVTLAYICYPLMTVLSIIVLIQSAISIFADRSRQPLSPQAYEAVSPQSNPAIPQCLPPNSIGSPRHDSNARIAAVALIAVLVIFMGALAINFDIAAKKSAEESAELWALLSESTSNFQAESETLFAQTSFPEKGFELENYFDVKKNDVSGGYQFFYRSKETGLSWSIYEEDDGKLIASMSCIFDDSSPLSGKVDDFVLVEEGGDYHMAFIYAGHGVSTLHPDEIAAVVDTIDKSTLDSYDERRVLDIVQGRESYEGIPEKDRS